MSLLDDETAWQVVQTINESNKLITHRRVENTGGANPSLNPVLGAITVSLTVTIGSSAVTLAAPAGNWFLEVGDNLSFGSTAAYIVQARNTATAGLFTNVQISPPTTLASSAGSSVQPVFTNDFPVLAAVSTYPYKMIDGTLVKAQDLLTTILPTDTGGRTIPTPSPTDREIIDGVLRTVGIVAPLYVGSDIVAWEIQAKG